MKPILHVNAGYTSPYAMSVFVALREKGIDFDVREVDLTAPRTGEYLAASLSGRVPLLEMDAFKLSESSAITEYLEELFPPPAYRALYPAHAAHRARARQVQAWIRSDLMPIRVERPTTVIFKARDPTPLSRQAQAAAALLFAAAESLIGSREQLFEAWCIADVDLAVMLNRLAKNGDAIPPKLAAYAQRQWERPSVAEWVRKATAG